MIKKNKNHQAFAFFFVLWVDLKESQKVLNMKQSKSKKIDKRFLK